MLYTETGGKTRAPAENPTLLWNMTSHTKPSFRVSSTNSSVIARNDEEVHYCSTEGVVESRVGWGGNADMPMWLFGQTRL